jgi:hypothetical protein
VVIRSAVLVLAGGLLAVPPLKATSLIERSPFLPPSFEARSTPPSPASAGETSAEDSLELRGVYTLGGILYANIHDKRDKASRWLRLNRPQDGMTLLDFDPRSNRCTVESADGARHVLQLARIPETVGRSVSTSVPTLPRTTRPGSEPPKPKALRASAGLDPEKHSLRLQARQRASAGNPVRLERLRREARLAQTKARRAAAGRGEAAVARPVASEPSHPEKKIRAIRLATAVGKPDGKSP